MHDNFSLTYAGAREKFLNAARAAGAQIKIYQHPRLGAEDETLATDVAWLGPHNARSLLVTVSGTHGIEGYYGSGCQVGWLREGHGARLPPDTAMLLIHASNPHGFSFGRRVNEDNMDINRNFVDFTTGLPRNDAYGTEVHPHLLPPQWDAGTMPRLAALLQELQVRLGKAAANAAVSAGQHDFPDGIFYGGRQPCWSNVTIQHVVRDFMLHAEKVCVLDFHTGLGPHGYSEMICRHPPGSPALELARTWFGGAVTSPAMGQSDSPVIEGNLRMGIARMRQAHRAGLITVAAAIEVGTQPPAEVLGAIIADNWLYLRGDWNSPQGTEIRAAMRRAFYPDTDAWRGLCYPRAVEIQKQALAGLSGS